MYKAFIRVFFNIGMCLLIAGVMITGTIGYIYWHIKPGLPNSNFLNNYQAPELTRVYDRHFRLIQEFAPVRRMNLKFEDIPEKVIAAFLVAEDRNFYYHPGIDPLRILRALFQNISHKKSQQNLVGASTITQQVAKNFLVGNEKSFLRKFREAFATLTIEHQLNKDRILELYLNQIYLGNGTYGVQAAALKYFGESIEDLTIAQACLLAALPKAPAQLSTVKNVKKLKYRRDAIIQALLEQEYITTREALLATKSPIEFHDHDAQNTGAIYGYYTTALRETLVSESPQLNITTGLEIFSCMDIRFQQAAQKALHDGLLKYDLTQKVFYKPIAKLGTHYSVENLEQISVPDCPKHFKKAIVDFKNKKPVVHLKNQKSLPLDTAGWSFETPLSIGDVILVEEKGSKALIRQIPEVSGAIVVMEARTGQVLALVGGWSSLTNPFNCATQAIRQPGSSFKPFVYLAALERGINTNDIIKDEPITMLLNNGREIYKPKNIDKKIHGYVTVKNSLAYSYNLASIQLGLDIGLEHVQDIAELFEVYYHASKHPSMILGSKETTLLKLTNAYAMIFNGGYHLRPRFYNSYTVRTNFTKTNASIYKNSTTCCLEKQQAFMAVPVSTFANHQRLASPSAIFGILEMLRAVITDGTGKSLLPLERSLRVKIRGKTGTTNNNHDAWFIGSVSIPGTIYQDNNPLVIGVFVGFLKPKNLGEGNGGAVVALPIFGNFIKNIVSDTL